MVLLTAAIVTYLTTPLVRRVALAVGAITAVRDRDVHSVPIPRLGGVAMAIAIGLIVSVAALNIIASLILLVMEKSRDIAILKTMGSPAKSIRRIFMLQGLIIGLIGTTIGAAGPPPGTKPPDPNAGDMNSTKISGLDGMPPTLRFRKNFPNFVNFTSSLPGSNSAKLMIGIRISRRCSAGVCFGAIFGAEGSM